MEESKVAEKSKGKKTTVAKKVITAPSDEVIAPTVIKAHGLTLTLDNSLKELANDPYVLEKVRIANEKFKSKAPGSLSIS